MIQTAFRLINHWPEIERTWPRLQKQIADIEQLWPRVQTTMEQTIKLANDVQALARKIAPELVGQPAAVQEQFPPMYDVKWLQQSLNTLIDAGLVVDGIYGQLTQAAVRRFQEQHGLVVDGWAGVATEAAIDAALQQRPA